MRCNPVFFWPIERSQDSRATIHDSKCHQHQDAGAIRHRGAAATHLRGVEIIHIQAIADGAFHGAKART